jgi:heptosyltransferase II
MTRRPASILVDLPNWVGDQVMAMPVVDRFVGADPGGVVVLHCRPPMRRLLAELFPAAVVVASVRRASPFAVARRLCRDRGRFDVGVTLRHASRAKLLLRLVVRRAFGSTGGGAFLLLSRAFPVDRTHHQIFDTDPILAELGLAGVDAEWRPTLPARLREEGAALLESARLGGGRTIALAPGAAWGESKMWPASRFGQLAGRLLGLGLQPLVVIGPGEEMLGAAVARAAAAPLPVVGSDVDVAGLAGLVAQVAALVGNDSGAMHMAAMVGTPVVALFGPTDPVRTAPVGSGHVVLSRRLRCAPCLQPHCPLGHTDCLAGLPVDEVAQAVLRLAGR